MNATPIQSIWEEFAQSGAADLRERLVLQYAPLVRYVIGRLTLARPADLDDDILSEGVLGLIEAVDRDEPAQGASFETLAIPRSRGRIIDRVRRMSWLPRRSLAPIKAVEQAIAMLQPTLKRHPTDAEPSTVSGHEVYLTGSVDIALASNDATDAESLFTGAGTALARAKKEGRNTYQRFAQEMNANASAIGTWRAAYGGRANATNRGCITSQKSISLRA